MCKHNDSVLFLEMTMNSNFPDDRFHIFDYKSLLFSLNNPASTEPPDNNLASTEPPKEGTTNVEPPKNGSVSSTPSKSESQGNNKKTVEKKKKYY